MIRYFSLIYLLLFSGLCFGQRGSDKVLAFPGAEGFGKYTSGGRGGIVTEVTNLDDNGPGSLRYAIDIDAPRTIVFKVSGIIELDSILYIRYGNLTLAGQSAPGDGICIKNYTVRIEADNVIIRHMRFRPGDIKKTEVDGLTGIGQKDIIIDHCSMSWATDENASFYDNENFTMQWCIISEALNDSYHYKGEHGYGGIWGGKGATFHHNLLAHNKSRNPRFCGSRYHDVPEDEIVDYRNNVICNWSGNSAYGGEGGNQNMVANYYKPGVATKGKLRYRIVQVSFNFYNMNINLDTILMGKWYIEDNFVEGYPKITQSNWDDGVQGISKEQKAEARLTRPVQYIPINEQSAVEAYNEVLLHAGASLPKRDKVDKRVIQEVKTGKPTFDNGIIDSQTEVGGWPQYNTSPQSMDTDHDGMPDDWERSNGLNPSDPEDRNGDLDNDGYTNLEEYLNK